MHATTGAIYRIDVSYTSDAGLAIYWRAVTGNLDSGTMHRKFYQSGEAVGDKVSATLQVRHSDDDYVTWSAWRTMSLSSARSIIRQMGQARRRAYEFLVTDNVALRLEAFELDLEGGEQQRDPQIG